MVTIRPYKTTDKEYVRKICYDNSSDNKVYRDNPELLLTLFCDYYIEVESDNCFVAVNEEDMPVGYIICSENFNEYKVKYKPYLKKLWKMGFKHWIDKVFANIREVKYSELYPAHLHIDIDSNYQRLGLGTKLMDALHIHLKGKGVHGIHLETGNDNEKAVRFYNKYGYNRISDKGAVFGLDLNSWEQKK